jgi:hypothetical protein
MRRFVSLISVCALLAGQTPFTPCPAAVVTDEGAAAPVAAAAARQHEHHHRAAATAVAGVANQTGADDADLTPPAAAGHGGSCTMLTRCDAVAVPIEPAASEPLRSLATASVATFGDAPATAELFSSTPPPRPAS